MKAKKKPLDVFNLSDLVPNAKLNSHYVRFEAPPARKAGIKVGSVEALVDKLANEARVI
jgi:electron transfer flavoprotein beta subunit